MSARPVCLKESKSFVLCEAKGTPAAPAWSRMKKAELAALAAREVAGTGWLPEVLRPLTTIEGTP
ncbi:MULTISPECIES: hypothetical protein [unclassified Rhizobium]|uniref:hypothetical protein n=1 Tax=unclassified Rhizobium TaxID=2613769 RepID=UPI00161FDCA8|nr:MULTISPECIES: hypothetical protein [unclassified Rhizobium]MBB3481922.1 hypothetical protein [Rhizobium sp. BK347]